MTTGRAVVSWPLHFTWMLLKVTVTLLVSQSLILSFISSVSDGPFTETGPHDLLPAVIEKEKLVTAQFSCWAINLGLRSTISWDVLALVIVPNKTSELASFIDNNALGAGPR